MDLELLKGHWNNWARIIVVYLDELCTFVSDIIRDMEKMRSGQFKFSKIIKNHFNLLSSEIKVTTPYVRIKVNGVRSLFQLVWAKAGEIDRADRETGFSFTIFLPSFSPVSPRLVFFFCSASHSQFYLASRAHPGWLLGVYIDLRWCHLMILFKTDKKLFAGLNKWNRFY